MYSIKRVRRLLTLGVLALSGCIRISAEGGDQAVRVYSFAQTHVDAVWLWNWEETIGALSNTFGGWLNYMKSDPKVQYNQDSAVFYEIIEERYPELFARIKAAVQAGQWNIVGGKWVESAMELSSGESIVRQYLYGKNYFRKKFGLDVLVDWEMEGSFYFPTIPQVLKKSGIKYAVLGRNPWDRMKRPIMHWKGCEGSSVLTVWCPHYLAEWPLNPTGLKTCVQEAQKYGATDQLALAYGGGDHGGLDKGQIEGIKKLSETSMPGLSLVRNVSPLAYFKQVESNAKPISDSSLDFSWFGGVHVSQWKIKAGNRAAENLLASAEIYTSMMASLKFKAPLASTESLYKQLCFDQFHDAIWGTCIYPVNNDLIASKQKILVEGEKMTRQVLSELSSQINTAGEGVPVLVFNSLPWEREDVVKLNKQELGPVINPDLKYEAIDGSGKSAAVQCLDERLFFIARHVPATGYKTYWLRAQQKSSPALAVEKNRDDEMNMVSAGLMRNRYYQVEIDTNTGVVISIRDRKNDVEVIKKPSNLLEVFRDDGDAWCTTLSDKLWGSDSSGKVKITTEQGNVRSAFRIEYTSNNISFVQHIALYHSLPRLEFELSGNFNIRNCAVVVSFSAGEKSDHFSAEIPFGYQDAAIGGGICAQKWAEVANEKYGMAMLSDSRYSFDSSIKGDLRMMIIRTPRFPRLDGKPYPPEWPNNSDLGEFSMNYGLYPHKDGWRSAGLNRKGYEYNYPLRAIVGKAEAEHHASTLPPTHSFLRIDQPNVMLSCWKTAEDGSGDSILRIYEAAGQKTDVVVTLPRLVSEIREVNMLEDIDTKAGLFARKAETIKRTLTPHEIATFRLKW